MAGDDDGKLRRLPSGRHGLSSEFVTRNQRERLTAGAIAAVVEHGYRDAGVSQIAKAAGVSRRTFYEHFSTREDCFLETYELIEVELLRIVVEADGESGAWAARVRSRTLALVEVLASNPNLARFTLLAPPAAGGELVEHERAFLRRLLASLTAGAPDGRGYSTPNEEELEALAGGVSAVLTAEVADGGAMPAIDTASQIVEMMLVPIIGRRRAVAEAEKTRSDGADQLPGGG